MRYSFALSALFAAIAVAAPLDNLVKDEQKRADDLIKGDHYHGSGGDSYHDDYKRRVTSDYYQVGDKRSDNLIKGDHYHGSDGDHYNDDY